MNPIPRSTRDEVTIINGANVVALAEMAAGMQGGAPDAKIRFRASNSWQGGKLDEAEVTLCDACKGTKRYSARKQIDRLVGALASCITTTVIYHAEVCGIQIQSAECELEGDLNLQGLLLPDSRVRSRCEDINVKFRVRSEATPEQIKQLARVSPISGIVSNPVNVALDIDAI